MSRNILWPLSLVFWVSAWTLSILFAYETWLNPHKRIVTADIVNLVKEQIVLAARKAKGKAVNRRHLARQIERSLLRVLNRIAIDNHVIIVPKQAVLAGSAEDITALVRAAVVGNGKSLYSNLDLFSAQEESRRE